nr:uncharacterized protein LOC112027463 [Quercus suber]
MDEVTSTETSPSSNQEVNDESPLWQYVTKVEKPPGASVKSGGNTYFKCNYCDIVYMGSYSRVKAHLLGISGKDSRIARMFYTGGLLFNFARNPYYRSSYAYAATHNIPSYLPPGYNALRTILLQKERAHVERLLKPIKDSWLENGISIVFDGWSDPQRRPFINIMAISDGGLVFIKAVDGSGEFKDKHYIAGVLKDAIKEIGHEKVVQVITDNASVMKSARALIEGEYPKIFWTPCAVHTLTLALKNICAAKNTEKNEVTYEECNWITRIGDDASFIRVFIMNHSMRLAMFNEFCPLKLLQVADTRFASVVVMLKRLKLIKRCLQAMAISDQWASYREDDVGKAQKVKDMILRDSWNASDIHGGAGILENVALTLDEPELEAMVIGNANSSATTSESEVRSEARSEAIDIEDDDFRTCEL